MRHKHDYVLQGRVSLRTKESKTVPVFKEPHNGDTQKSQCIAPAFLIWALEAFKKQASCHKSFKCRDVQRIRGRSVSYGEEKYVFLARIRFRNVRIILTELSGSKQMECEVRCTTFN